MTAPVMFGIDSNKVIRPLLVDFTGAPLIVGYAGNPLLNYANVFHSYWEELNLVAGVNTHDYPTLLAGQMVYVTAVWFRYSVTIAANHVRFSIFDGVNDFPFTDQLGPVANTGYPLQVCIPIKASERIRVTITAAAVGNDIFTSVLGWMMNVP
jgi:hypothetical protein